MDGSSAPGASLRNEVFKAPRRFLSWGWGDTASARGPWAFLSKSPLPDRDDQVSDVDATPTADAISLDNTGVSEIIITSDKPERIFLKRGPKPKRRNAWKKASRQDVARAGRKAVAITKTMGAPTYYQQENITVILDAIAAGASLTKACQQLGIPWKTVWNWRTRHPDFRAAYDRAVEERAHAQAEQVLDIADDDTNDVIARVSPKGKEQKTVIAKIVR
jgi:hypothetical protein